MKNAKALKAKSEPSPARLFLKSKKGKGLIALLLAICILASALLAIYLPAGAVVYRYKGASMREDVYRYYFACFKYDYMIRYKALDITDTKEGWQAVGEDGKTYEEAFKEAIDEEIKLRLVASRLFDSHGLSLSERDYALIDAFFTGMETYSYDEAPYKTLKDTYHIRAKRVLKQVALYERKYEALLYAMFGTDGSGVFADQYSEDLALFYEKYYYRYNVIFVEDKNSKNNQTIRAALGNGISPEEFEALEKEYSDTEVTSGKFPNGIYLYAGASYTPGTSGLDASLIAAMQSLDEVGDFTEARSDLDDGTYYVLRYALDEAPYLKEGDWVKTAFDSLPAAASVYIYRKQLAEEFENVTVKKAEKKQTVWESVACKNYNVVRSIGG